MKRIALEIRRGENLDIYLGGALAVVIGLLGALQVVSAQVIGAAIVATLGLLSISMLHNRRTMDAVQQSTIDLQDQVARWSAEGKSLPRASDVLLCGYPNLSKEFQGATRVSVLGIAVHRILLDYSGELDQMLRRGGALRFLIAEQSPVMHAQLVFRSSTTGDADEIKSRLKSSAKRIKSVADRTHAHDHVAVKTIPYVPPFSLVWVENADSPAFIVVRMYSFRRPDVEQPTFVVNEDLDRKWFLHFRDQYEQLWENCQELILQ